MPLAILSFRLFPKSRLLSFLRLVNFLCEWIDRRRAGGYGRRERNPCQMNSATALRLSPLDLARTAESPSAALGRPRNSSSGGRPGSLSSGAPRGRLIMRRIAVNHMFGKGRDPAFRTADDGLSYKNLLSPRARTSWCDTLSVFYFALSDRPFMSTLAASRRAFHLFSFRCHPFPPPLWREAHSKALHGAVYSTASTHIQICPYAIYQYLKEASKVLDSASKPDNCVIIFNELI